MTFIYQQDVLPVADSGGGGAQGAPPLLKFQRGSSNGTAAAPPLSTNPGSAPDCPCHGPCHGITKERWIVRWLLGNRILNNNYSNSAWPFIEKSSGVRFCKPERYLWKPRWSQVRGFYWNTHSLPIQIALLPLVQKISLAKISFDIETHPW